MQPYTEEDIKHILNCTRSIDGEHNFNMSVSSSETTDRSGNRHSRCGDVLCCKCLQLIPMSEVHAINVLNINQMYRPEKLAEQ